MDMDLQKKELLNTILNKFKKQRELYFYYMNNPTEIESILKEGAIKARKIAKQNIEPIRKILGV